MRAEPNGTFQPVDVEIGVETNGETEIRSGLAAGDRIVVSGQFLLDSEANLRAASTRMEAMPPQQSSSAVHEGDGRIEALGDASVTLSHGPIPSAQWNSMTMQFGLPADRPAAELAVGQSVHFTFVFGDDGKPRIVEIAPAPGGDR
jgi:Cu(I)/Ag(I) efflux system membrane fusion protein